MVKATARICRKPAATFRIIELSIGLDRGRGSEEETVDSLAAGKNRPSEPNNLESSDWSPLCMAN